MRKSAMAVVAWWVGGLLLVHGGAAASDEGGIARRYHALEAPTLDALATGVGRLTFGRSTIEVGKGSKLYRMSAGGTPCGVLIDGESTWRLRVEDRHSQGLARRNLRRVGGLASREEGGALLVETKLNAAAIWSWVLPAGVLTWEPIGVRSAPEWLRKRLERRSSASPAGEMLASEADGRERFAWALLHGERNDYVARWDARQLSGIEWLGKVDAVDTRNAYRGRWSQIGLVGQPTEGDWWTLVRGRDFEPAQVNVQFKEEPGRVARVSSKLRLEAARDGVGVLALILDSESPSPAGALRKVTLDSVRLGGQPASYVHDRGGLWLGLPAPLRKGQRIEVEVTSSAEMLDHVEGDSYWLAIGNWAPRLTGGGSQGAARYSIEMETPKPMVPFAPGRTVARMETERTHRLLTELRAPVSRAVLAAGKYTTSFSRADGYAIGVSAYGPHEASETERIATVISAVRQCLEGLLDEPYPFEELRVLQVNEWGWGMAPPGFIFMTQEAFLSQARTAAMPVRRTLAKKMVANVDARLAHEVGHGWFPHVAQLSGSEDAWLSESFSEYLSAVCVNLSMSDPRRRQEAWRYQFGLWTEYSGAVGQGASLFFAAYLAQVGDQDSADSRGLLYGRGPLVLHALRQELARQAGNEPDGERQFFNWLRSILKEHRFRPTRTADVVALLEKQTGKSWRPWFERYVYGAEPPPVVD